MIVDNAKHLIIQTAWLNINISNNRITMCKLLDGHRYHAPEYAVALHRENSMTSFASGFRYADSFCPSYCSEVPSKRNLVRGDRRLQNAHAVDSHLSWVVLLFSTQLFALQTIIVDFFKLSPLTMSPDAADQKLVEMSEGDSEDVNIAAICSNGVASAGGIEDIVASLESRVCQQLGSNVVPLDTGLWVGRKSMVFRFGITIVVAFEATQDNDLVVNAWSHAKDDTWWSLPYARLIDGRQVHSFYLDMWLGMRNAALPAISQEIEELEKEGQAPSRMLVTGHSMGGGIST